MNPLFGLNLKNNSMSLGEKKMSHKQIDRKRKKEALKQMRSDFRKSVSNLNKTIGY